MRKTTPPVLFLTFNRPEQTAKVFETIRKAEPPRLYFASDGPRKDRPDERSLVEACRQHVADNIDWPCELHTLFRESNLGLGAAVSEAIDWFFENEEEGIILEDDCLPDPTFFGYCGELLQQFRDNERVMHIAGCCHIDGSSIEGSYYLSRHPHIWGWATWRSAWAKFSRERPGDLEAEFEPIAALMGSPEERAHWRFILTQTFAGKIEIWSYFWIYSIWRQGGLSVYPSRNMIRNIGFGPEAVHTRAWKDYKGLRRLVHEPMPQVIHPYRAGTRPDLDEMDFRAYYRRPGLAKRLALVLQRSVGHGFETARAKFGR